MKTEIILEKTLPKTLQIYRNNLTDAVGLRIVRADGTKPDASELVVLHPGTSLLKVGEVVKRDLPNGFTDWSPTVEPITIRFTP